MTHTDKNNWDEKPIIVIEDDDVDTTAQDCQEVPVITIETDEPEETTPQPSKLRRWMKYALCTIAALAVLIVGYVGVRLYNYYYNIGVSISVSPKENIAKLMSKETAHEQAGITLKRDSVLGVALDMYELHNVRGELTLAEPDTTDASVLLCTRTADYTATGAYIGSLVVDGKELRSDASRLGYCAMADGRMVVGISRSDKVKSYVEERGGAFFRQFILVSNGELPRKFFLHGKVPRKALARTADDKLCVVTTRHAETLWDFADALREYGFVDAIYLTGGNDLGYWRDNEGQVHTTDTAEQYRHEKHHGKAPWLVLKQPAAK